jgi:Domain of unknown function (DUF3883)
VVNIFNFVAVNTVEGRVLEKLLEKLDEIRNAMGDRVFDVIGQLLQLNNMQFEDLVREATYSKANEEDALEQIEKLDPIRLEELEKATGVALATSHVDLSHLRHTQQQDLLSEEQRLMPRYVEEFFKRACDFMKLTLEVRADGLWRIPYIKEEFRSNNLDSVRRLGAPEKQYLKATFYKEQMANPTQQDAELLSPGHPLFAALAERINTQLDDDVRGGTAVYIDADAEAPYQVYFFEVEAAGQMRSGKDSTLAARLCAVLERQDGQLELAAPDCLHDLAPTATSSSVSKKSPSPQEQQRVGNWLKVKVQIPMVENQRHARHRELEIRQEYLKRAMEAAIKEAKSVQMRLAGKVAGGDETYRVARDQAQKKVRNLEERYKARQGELDYLQIVRPGRVRYLGVALVSPVPAEINQPGMRNDPEVEAFAMKYVMEYEVSRGWIPEDVSKNHDGSGFDIRCVGPVDPETGFVPVRRIEVKGRAADHQDVSLTSNEWRKAQQLGDSYWLYVVWGCKTGAPRMITIQNPARALQGDIKEIKQVTRYIIGADAIERSETVIQSMGTK